MKTRIICCLLLGLLSLCRAATTVTDPDKWTPEEKKMWAQRAREHVFMVNLDGKIMDPAAEWGWAQASADKPTVTNQLNKIEAGIKGFYQRNPAAANRVIVFVHGGLNSYTSSAKRFIRYYDEMEANNCYPLLVVWNSGLFSSYGEHLWRIRQGEKHRVLGPVTLPFVFGVDLAKGVARFPLTATARIVNDWKTTELPNSESTKRFETFENNAATLANHGMVRPASPEGNKRTVQERTKRGIFYGLTIPIKLGTLPIIDGVGSEAWDMMLRRTKTMFVPPDISDLSHDDFDMMNKNPDLMARWINRDNTTEDEIQGAMYLFSRRLVKWTDSDNKDRYLPVPFEFYGHSMGAIVLNEMFRAAPEINTTNIVYMAAACTVRDFESAQLPYLKSHTNASFYSLSLHRIRDYDECYYFDLPVRGSLLNWIDDIFAKPQTIADRTFGAWPNVIRTLPDVPIPLRDRVHFRACEIVEEYSPVLPWVNNPKADYPQTHGSFSDYPFWRREFVWPEPGTPPVGPLP